MPYLNHAFVQAFIASFVLFTLVAGAILSAYEYGLAQRRNPPKG